MSAYRPSVSIQRLFAVLVALAVLLAPALTHASAAAAAVADHHMQMMESGHCEAPPSDLGDEDQAPANSCCISACIGIAVTPAVPLNDNAVQPAPARFDLSTLHLSYLGEIATPPPRRS